MIKGSTLQEDATTINEYSPNARAGSFINQILMALNGDINSNRVIMIEFNISLSSMYRKSRIENQ